MGDKGLSQFRPPKPKGETHIAFEIVFSNEKVEGSGGPYRQFFADISKELQPSKLEIGNMAEEKLLSLLVPSANNHAKEKFGGGFFVVNPLKDGDQAKGSSAGDLAHYEFLGLIMGVCVRTGSNLMLDLPKVVWKRIVGQKFELDDIYEVDLRFVAKMKTVLEAQNDEDLV
jgi:other hect domain ubiquitin protein ligase E3